MTWLLFSHPMYCAAPPHRQQLTAADKQRLAGILWRDFGAMKPGERTDEIKNLLSVSERSIQAWTKDERANEKTEQQAKVWDLWLDCVDSFTDIAVEMGFATNNDDDDEEAKKQLHAAGELVRSWVAEKRKNADFCDPPGKTDKKPWGNVQHFDIWQFAKANGDSTYFGQMPPHAIVILSCFSLIPLYWQD